MLELYPFLLFVYPFVKAPKIVLKHVVFVRTKEQFKTSKYSKGVDSNKECRTPAYQADHVSSNTPWRGKKNLGANVIVSLELKSEKTYCFSNNLISE